MSVFEKIKNLPDGHLLYLSIVGEYWKLKIGEYDCLKQFKLYNPKINNEFYTFNENGEMFSGGECVVFPSKDNRDWDKFSYYKAGNVITISKSPYLIVSITDDEINCLSLNTGYVLNKKKENFDYPIESDKYNPYEYLKPYDKVLIKECGGNVWFPSILSYTSNKQIFCNHTDYGVDLCIPYNNLTMHLAGKDLECPECYKYW